MEVTSPGAKWSECPRQWLATLRRARSAPQPSFRLINVQTESLGATESNGGNSDWAPLPRCVRRQSRSSGWTANESREGEAWLLRTARANVKFPLAGWGRKGPDSSRRRIWIRDGGTASVCAFLPKPPRCFCTAAVSSVLSPAASVAVRGVFCRLLARFMLGNPRGLSDVEKKRSLFLVSERRDG